jgi:hypothetical protein
VTRLQREWPTTTQNNQQVPDLAQAPFALMAIVNRIDLQATGNGQLRFLFGLHPSAMAPQLNPQAQSFTVSFDYLLPSTQQLPDRRAWAAAFHALGQAAFAPAGDYNVRLQALTDLVTGPSMPSSPDNPSGSGLYALRINDGFLNDTTGDSGEQLRQFRLLPDPTTGTVDLMLTPVDQTPDSALNGQPGALPDFLNANRARVEAGFATMPADLLAARALVPGTIVRWAFASVTDEPLRHAFAGQTCSGCHGTEPPGTVLASYHVSPYVGSPEPNNMSNFIRYVELPRRAAFMQNQLTCAGATCATGGAEMMGPAP